jgi:hypothetical protein
LKLLGRGSGLLLDLRLRAARLGFGKRTFRGFRERFALRFGGCGHDRQNRILGHRDFHSLMGSRSIHVSVTVRVGSSRIFWVFENIGTILTFGIFACQKSDPATMDRADAGRIIVKLLL